VVADHVRDKPDDKPDQGHGPMISLLAPALLEVRAFAAPPAGDRIAELVGMVCPPSQLEERIDAQGADPGHEEHHEDRPERFHRQPPSLICEVSAAAWRAPSGSALTQALETTERSLG
jgi:hypothetical protein